MSQQKHVPVLAQEAIEHLSPSQNDQYLDLTAGYGGHAKMVLDRIGPHGFMTLVDRDVQSIESLREIFEASSNVEYLHKDFLSASKELAAQNRKFDIVFADLGVSSPHLDNASRGFSFNKEGPLDMRMDQSQQLTAEEVINNYSEDQLVKIFRDYGEIKNAVKVARRVIEYRPYRTTVELANKIAQIVRGKKRIHPATEIFQAIRIAVNSELQMLEKSLPLWIDLLKPGGRIGVISFHSLEDRLVKQAFRDYGGDRYDAKLQAVTKQVIKCSKQEAVFNPRARSAKLRVAQRK